jgi:hypothetical protein
MLDRVVGDVQLVAGVQVLAEHQGEAVDEALHLGGLRQKTRTAPLLPEDDVVGPAVEVVRPRL